MSLVTDTTRRGDGEWLWRAVGVNILFFSMCYLLFYFTIQLTKLTKFGRTKNVYFSHKVSILKQKKYMTPLGKILVRGEGKALACACIVTSHSSPYSRFSQTHQIDNIGIIGVPKLILISDTLLSEASQACITLEISKLSFVPTPLEFETQMIWINRDDHIKVFKL